VGLLVLPALTPKQASPFKLARGARAEGTTMRKPIRWTARIDSGPLGFNLSNPSNGNRLLISSNVFLEREPA
jgi:hypothetical protein